MKEKNWHKLADVMLSSFSPSFLFLLLLSQLTVVTATINSRHADKIRESFVQETYMDNQATTLEVSQKGINDYMDVVGYSDDKVVILKMDRFPDKDGFFEHEVVTIYMKSNE